MNDPKRISAMASQNGVAITSMPFSIKFFLSEIWET